MGRGGARLRWLRGRLLRGLLRASVEMLRARGWVFTSFSVQAEWWEKLIPGVYAGQRDRSQGAGGDSGGTSRDKPGTVEGARCVVLQLERAPDTGRLHWQGCIEFTCLKSRAAASAWFGAENVHLERRRGSLDEAFAYCSKDDSRAKQRDDGPQPGPHWYGDFTSIGQGRRTDLEAARACLLRDADGDGPGTSVFTGVSERHFADNHFTVWAKHPGVYERVRALWCSEPHPSELRHRHIYYIFGRTGVGKSYAAREWIQQLMSARGWDAWWSKGPCNKWFDGYCGQKVVLFDDYRGSWLQLSLALQVFDSGGYGSNLEVKGRNTWWAPEYVFVTADRKPDMVYRVSEEDQQQWCRRMGSIPGHEGMCIEMVARGEWRWVPVRTQIEVTWENEAD